MSSSLRISPRPCPLIARALGKYVEDVEVDPYLPGEDDPEVDCVVNVRPLTGHGYGKRYASLYFVGGRLHDGDVQMPEKFVPKVREVIKKAARSCKLEGMHEHKGDSEFGTAGAYHVHLSRCNIGDLGKVLQAAEY